MAGKSGVYWANNGPDGFGQSLSVLANSLEGMADDVVEYITEGAADRMREIINDGGINKTAKGGARVGKTGDMLASVDSERATGGNRVRGNFGFIDNAPFYTKFQERGTLTQGPSRAAKGGGGIASMLAFATAQAEAIVEMQDLMQETQWFAMSNLRRVGR